MDHATLTTPLLRMNFVILMLGLDIAYLCTKFDDCNLSCSRDYGSAHQNRNGSRDLITPFSGMVSHPWTIAITTISLSTKFEVSISTHHVDLTGDTVSKIGWFGIFRGHSRSLEIASFDRTHKISYYRFIVTMSPI